MTARNGYEADARTLKACRIMDALLVAKPDITADEVDQMSVTARRAAERVADVRPASETTWAEVVEIMRREEAHNAARGLS